MKRLIFISAATLAVGSMTAAVISQSNDLTNYKLLSQSAVAQQQASDFAAAKTAAAEAQKRLDEGNIAALRAECQKGLVAYGSLTASQKAKTPAPKCQ